MEKVKVKQYNKHNQFIMEYNSMTEAAKAVNGQEQHISECAGYIPHRHTHKGYKWRKSNEQHITMGETKN